ncbi:LysR family transcriptional regulator [Pigmentiphaga aceris]|uniref:LysR family transcriptional regulator n=1 Tax=Pigmentiphaga aceris TaxID=1940612 RepID=A0A5C0AVK8_9BURK|nr:LysR family transcriptional regulator [Pigmentiphaga aceris]QEI06235.1 LysR family transcriptional regulator [Pigmentiphaga aceris]
MDHLHAIRVFLRVVDAGSFTRAADTMGMPRSSVTSLVKQLEAHVGVVLIQRSTRSFSLTEQGEQYHRYCVDVLAGLENMEASLRGDTAKPRGRVRVDMPGALARALVLPQMKEFQQRYPDIEISLGLNDRNVDVIGEGIDCAVRTGPLPDSSLVARSLGSLQWIICAATTYLNQHGEPENLEQLRQHEIVNYASATTGRAREWVFQVDGQNAAIALPGRLLVNETDAYLQCALEGLGMIQLTEFLARPYLQSGRLREVLRHLRPPPMPVSVVYASRQHQPQAVRVFIEWLTELVAQNPLSSDGAD